MGLGSQGKNTRCSGCIARATARCGGFVVFVLVHVPGPVVHACGPVFHRIVWLCPRPSRGCAQDTNTNKCSVPCRLPGRCRGACRGGRGAAAPPRGAAPLRGAAPPCLGAPPCRGAPPRSPNADRQMPTGGALGEPSRSIERCLACFGTAHAWIGRDASQETLQQPYETRASAPNAPLASNWR